MVSYVDIRQPGGGSSRSLKRHLAVGLGFFTLLLTAGLSFLVEHLAAESSMRQIGLQLAEHAAETRDRVDAGLRERFRDIRSLAAFDAGPAEAGAMTRARIESMRRGRPLFAWIGHADASGRVIAAAGGVLEGADVSGQPWFKRALQGPAIDDRVGLDALPGGKNEDLRFVAIGMPVRDTAGRVSGVVGAFLDWEALHQARPAVGGATRVFVLSEDGQVLYGIRGLEGKKLALKSIADAGPANSVWRRERWPDGDTYITAASTTRGHADYLKTGWTVVLRQDPGEALAEVSRMQLQIAAAGVLIGLLFAGLAWWFADRVASPLASISDAADRLGAGERDLSIPAVSGYAEVERLGRSLRAMLTNLRRQEEDLVLARDKLDLRVRERAAELNRTRAELEATVAERELAQRELAREKERLDLALDAAEVAVWTYDLASGRIELSEQWSAMLGGARGITVSPVADLIALVPEAERGAVKDAMAAVANGIKESYVVRHHVKRANGDLLLTESRGRVVERDGGGLAVRLAGTVRAI